MIKCGNLLCKWCDESYRCTKEDIILSAIGSREHFLKCDSYEEDAYIQVVKEAMKKNLKDMWD